MQRNEEVLAQYEANNTPGRGQFDPRKGIYKIISTYQGTCYGKPAQMATVNWKDSVNHSYSDEVFTIQLESFKVGCNPLDTTNIVGREVEVVATTWFPNLPLFIVKWALIPNHLTRLNALNSIIKKDPSRINLNELGDQEDAWENEFDVEDNDLGDY